MSGKPTRFEALHGFVRGYRSKTSYKEHTVPSLIQEPVWTYEDVSYLFQGTNLLDNSEPAIFVYHNLCDDAHAVCGRSTNSIG